MTGIKNIIFDLGEVLINLDYQKTINAFKAMGIKNFDDMYTKVSVGEVFEKLETGRIAEPDFYDAIKKVAETPVTNSQIETAWNAILLDFRPQSLAFLETLTTKYKLYLFSNTNSIHYRCFQGILQQTNGKSSLDDYFTKAWYSHLIHLRKPNTAAFEFVLKDAGIAASETLFIDDLVKNIEGAAAVGMQTHLLLPEERIENLGFI